MMVMVVMMKMPSKKERVWQVFKNILSGPARSWSAFNPWSGRSRGSQWVQGLPGRWLSSGMYNNVSLSSICCQSKILRCEHLWNQFFKVSPLMVFSQCHPVLKGNIYSKVIVCIVTIMIILIFLHIIDHLLQFWFRFWSSSSSIIIIAPMMIIFVQVCLVEEKQASLEKSLINQFSSECQQVISIFGLCDWQNSEDWNISQDSYFYMVESAGKEEALAEVIRVGPGELKKAWTWKRKKPTWQIKD